MIVQINLAPSRRQLQQFGWIALLAFCALGTVVLWKGALFGASLGSSTRLVAYTLWALGLLSGAFSFLWPRANLPLFVLLSLVSFPFGMLVSHLVLALLFFGVITPVAFLFRLMRRDPLHRKWEPERESYWADMRPIIDETDYFRQF